MQGDRIRLARPDEAGAIALMSRELIEHGLGWSWMPPRVRRSILDLHSNVVVVPGAESADAELAGFGIMKYHDDEAHLLLLAVDPAARRQGLGRAMVDWLEASARVAGLGQVLLEARAGNAGARAFYRALGYREIQWLPGYYSGREASVRLAKDLWTPRSALA